MSRKANFSNLDWITVLLYIIFVMWGLISIYSTTYTGASFSDSLLNINTLTGKQFMWICISMIVVVVLFVLRNGWFETYAELIYLMSVLLLIGLFVIGKRINGSLSWYQLGGISFQPSELAKIGTALMLSKYLTQSQINLSKLKYQAWAILIILIPAGLILLQPDAGTVLVFVLMTLALFRHNFPIDYLVGILIIAIGILLTIISSYKLAIGTYVVLGMLSIVLRKGKKFYMVHLFLLVLLSGVSYGFSLIYDRLPERHQNRIEIVLRLKEDPKGTGYNIQQSLIAISAGDWTGKDFLQGTQTKLNFVPEQETDFIFTMIAEEGGFVQAGILLVLFCYFIIHILMIAERQRSDFARFYGYFVAMIFATHVVINTGMIMKLLPVIGIPLPFFSYGGSSLICFTILLFLLLKFDIYRKTEL